MKNDDINNSESPFFPGNADIAGRPLQSITNKDFLDSYIRDHILLVLVGVITALLFFVLTSMRLDAQGLYYDELHQATASFAYIGEKPVQFSLLNIHDIPIMNMSYSGAIKTTIYGLYLRISHQGFSDTSWRLVGIFFVCIALVLLCIIIGKKISWLGFITFYLFLITDSTVILTTRHDWGPTALALALRIILIAVWLSGELKNQVSWKNSLFLGVLVGFSLFEKLSSVALLLPLGIMMFFSHRRRKLKQVFACMIGGLIGLMPLILANLYTFIRSHSFVSLQFSSNHTVFSWTSFLQFIKDFLGLGTGYQVQSFILGIKQPLPLQSYEIAIMCFFIVAILSTFFLPYNLSKQFYLSRTLMVAYISILFALYFFPLKTWVHHWEIGTPLQYGAIALFINTIWNNVSSSNKKGKAGSIFVLFFMFLFLVFRISILIPVEQSLIKGDASLKWDHSLTKIGQFAETRKDAFFISANWGTANQIICYQNGVTDNLFQPDWNPYETSIKNISDIFLRTKKSEVYIFFSKFNPDGDPESQQRIMADIRKSIGPYWVEQTPVEPVVANMKSVTVYKFMRSQ